MSDSDLLHTKGISIDKENLYLYAYIAEQSPYIIVITDFEGIVIYVNPKFTQQTGYIFEEVKGKNVSIMKSGKTPSHTYKVLWDTITKGEEWQGEFYNKKKNGTFYWESAFIAPIKTSEGIITHFFKIAQDITYHKRTENKLREKEKRYRALFNHTNDGVFILDLDLVHLEVNQRAADMLGYTTEELKGMPVSPLVGKGEYKDSLRVRNALLAGEKIPMYERILRRKDGTEFPGEINVTLAYDDKGAPLHIQSVVRDITERKRAETALQDREKRYRALFDHTNDAVFLIGLDLLHIEVNQRAADMLGYTTAELVGMPVSQIVPDYEYPDTLRIRKALLAGEHIPVYERILRKKDGTEFPVEINVAMVFDATGAPLHIQSVVRDITERKRVEKKLKESSTAINELNESLTIINKILRHDILNDMMVIQGNLDLYREHKDETDLEQAYKITDKSVDLINRMRELENLIFHENAQKNYNIREIVDGILEKYESYNVKFSVKGECTALADQALVSAIENIIQNALIHSNSDRIDILIDEQKEFCELRIVDCGIGIPEEVKASIFEAGFKYGKTGRTGLGLYIVKKVIERYGEVRVENNSPNGTIFVLKLNR
ncbi:MAG: PAS domain S-box protein [Promethearchaeota archaeon]